MSNFRNPINRAGDAHYSELRELIGEDAFREFFIFRRWWLAYLVSAGVLVVLGVALQYVINVDSLVGVLILMSVLAIGGVFIMSRLVRAQRSAAAFNDLAPKYSFGLELRRGGAVFLETLERAREREARARP